MGKIVRKKVASKGLSAQYARRGWKVVRTSSTATLYMSVLPLQVRKSMAQANKQERVLSTGVVVGRFLNRNDGKAFVGREKRGG